MDRIWLIWISQQRKNLYEFTPVNQWSATCLNLISMSEIRQADGFFKLRLDCNLCQRNSADLEECRHHKGTSLYWLKDPAWRNTRTSIYCVLYCLYCVFVLFRLFVFFLICSVCTSVRTTATKRKLNYSSSSSSSSSSKNNNSSSSSSSSSSNVGRVAQSV